MTRRGLLLVLATVLCLTPFAGKAFHMDDPLFLWTARQILSRPADFYGFRVNWYGADMAMAEVIQNPPLTSYSLAAAAAVAGWRETALHLAFLMPSLAAVLGTYVLARTLCARPLLAAFLALLTPAVVVSGTSLMSDTLLVACWVWAAALWVRGIERQSPASLAGAAGLVALAVLTKYFGATLVPLLLAYGLARRRRLERWALWLLLPLGVLAAYQWAALTLYGRGLLFDAGAYAGAFRSEMSVPLWARAETVLAFTGGGLATVAFLGPWCWSRRAIGGSMAAVAAATLAVVGAGSIGGHPLIDAAGLRWPLVAQLGLWTLGGLSVVALPVADLWHRRDAPSLLLGLWLLGTLAFAGLFNWSVNVRTILPMAPAAAILLVRRLEQRGTLKPGRSGWPLLFPLAAGAGLALWVAQADYALANSARQAAAVVHRLHGRGPGPLWFEGHWGFHYYMEAAGGRAVDWGGARPAPGDTLVVPDNNTNTFLMPRGSVSLLRVVEVPSPALMATMNRAVGAGFYSDVWGPLPFAVGRVPPERYYVFVARGR